MSETTPNTAPPQPDEARAADPSAGDPRVFDGPALAPRFRPRAPEGPPGLLRRLHLALRDRLPDAWVVRRNYYHRFGYYPDLDRPRLLSEKINWLKLNGATPLHTLCADKIRVRDWVADRIGPEHLVRAILTTYDPDDITPERIPDAQFVVKANHDTGSVTICTDRDAFDWQGCREAMRTALATPFWRRQRERHYRDIRPGIIVEEMLVPDDPVVGLTDYKFHCCHGEPSHIELQIRPPGEIYNATYSTDWKRLPWLLLAELYDSPQWPGDIPRPSRLDEMLAIARTLAEPFPFARVDLYEVAGRVLFGEMSFTPAAGLERAEYIDRGDDPTRLDAELGQRLDIRRAQAQLAEIRAQYGT